MQKGIFDIQVVIKCSVAALAISAALIFQDCAHAKQVQEHILIVPAGDVDRKILESIKNDLPDLWPVGMSNEIFPAEALPESAYNPSTGQYEAGTVLEEISQRINIVPVTERILIVTDADLYVPGKNFVFGLADEKTGVAIISTSRLLRDRALKEALHESARCRGLAHCSKPKCAMFFSNTLADIDRKRAKLCNTCYNKLYRKYNSPMFKNPGS